MQNIFSKFIDEVDQNPNDITKESNQLLDSSSSQKTLEKFSGELLIGGCVDWENATGSNPLGLDQIHRINLTKKVYKTFSSSSSMHEFILLEDQTTLYAMGRNEHGQLGTGDALTYKYPVAISSPLNSKIKKLSTGRSHSLLLYETGELYGVGANNYGQIGLGSTKNALKDTLKFTKINFSKKILDISCGYDFSVFCDVDGECWTFGHTEYGQLGNGIDGQYIASGKGPTIQYSCVYSPQRIDKYICKDQHGKVINEVHYDSIYIKAIAAGKNHVIALEDWEQSDNNMKTNNLNRVFSWGFGGYGRLGHNSSNNEFIPREIIQFSNYSTINNQKQQIAPTNQQKQIRSIIVGSSFSLAISESKHLYYWGKMSNAPRGEANVYPQIQSELFDYPVESCTAGSNLIIVITKNKKSNSSSSTNIHKDMKCCIAWGVPIAGKIGFDGDSKTSTNPKFLTSLNDLDLLNITCGYGHISIVVNAINNDDISMNKLKSFPILYDINTIKDVVTSSNTKTKSTKKVNNEDNNKNPTKKMKK